MNRAFQAFVDDPTLEHFLVVRDEVLAEPGFDPRSLVLTEVSAALDDGRFEEVLQRVHALLPLWRLSPRVHFLRGVAASELGIAETAQHERRQMQACLQGLLSTGKGTRDDPFLATYASDEYDLLRALGREPDSQQLVETGSGRFDVIACRDGTEVWFDVSQLIRMAVAPRPASAGRARRQSPVARPL